MSDELVVKSETLLSYTHLFFFYACMFLKSQMKNFFEYSYKPHYWDVSKN